MKLLYCKKCHDVIRLTREKRYCECKDIWGNYKEDGWHAIVSSNAVVIGFDNWEFSDAIANTAKNGYAWPFEAFTIETDCSTVERVKTEKKSLCDVTWDKTGFVPSHEEIKYPIAGEWKVDGHQPLLGKIETLFDNKSLSEHEPMPEKNDYPAVWDLVKLDIEQRDKVGQERYGTRLQGHNGRDALVDAYQEALDLVVYLRQLIWEKNHPVGQQNKCSTQDVA